MNNIFTERSIDIVARTIYGEARGEYYSSTGGLPALIAVANVIYNRFNQSGEKLIENICIKPRQFSCWNLSDPNLEVLAQVTERDPIFKLCKQTAKQVLEGQWPDITKGANHYYSSLLKKQPYWSVGQIPTIKIGHHIFLKL